MENNNYIDSSETQISESSEEEIPTIIRTNKYPCPFCTLMMHVIKKYEQDGTVDMDEEDKHYFLFHLRRDHGPEP